MRYSGNGSADGLLQYINGKRLVIGRKFYTTLCRDPGSACNEQDFDDFTTGAVALLDYSNTDCSLYDKVVYNYRS